MPSLTLAERVAVTDQLDYAVLKYLLNNRGKFEYVPKSIIRDNTGLTNGELEVSLLKLLKTGALLKTKVRGEDSYSITFTGLDILATKGLYAKRVLKRLGIVVGEGKESQVVYGYDFDDNLLVVKFHRVGRRSYKRNVRGDTTIKDWVLKTLENARREYEAMNCVKQNMGNVPKPLGLSINAVALEFVEGVQLNKAELRDPQKALDSVLGTLRIAYVYCGGLVHGDLSPYNVMVDSSESVFVIDWPQATRDDTLLINDLKNILGHFKEKYGLDYDMDRVEEYVKGKA